MMVALDRQTKLNKYLAIITTFHLHHQDAHDSATLCNKLVFIFASEATTYSDYITDFI